MAEFVTSVVAAMDRLHPGWGEQWGVVAVSGGADSVALLRTLHDANPHGGLVVAHLNHQLRGPESEGDEAFVRELADRLGLAFRCERVFIASLGGNLEGMARTVRYEWLAKVAADTGAGWIATGHTADDQAETLLHRLVRGTGLTGLRGIAGTRFVEEALTPRPSLHECGGGVQDGSVLHEPPTCVGMPTGTSQNDSPLNTPSPGRRGGRGVRSPLLLRPLLALTRAQVLKYLDALGQPFRTDSSNADLAFTRNRIRAELLPLLRTFNPAIVELLGRLAAQAEEATEWLTDDARKLLRDAERPRAGDVIVLDGNLLSVVGEARTRATLRELWDRERWPVNGMTFAHWRRAAAVALGTHPAADFPAGVHVRRAGAVVQIRRRPYDNG